MAIDLDVDADDQDQAETFDETHITEDGDDIARPDVMRNVFDVTSAEDDADDDLADEDPDDFDPDELEETELEVLLEEDDGVDDDEGPATRDAADLVAADDASPARFEGGVDDDDNDVEGEDEPDRQAGAVDRRRDVELEETFPASDSPPANPGSD